MHLLCAATVPNALPRLKDCRKLSLAAHEVLVPMALAVAATAVLAGLVVLARPEPTIAYAQAHTVWVAVVLGLAAVATSLAAGLALALRR